MQNVSLDPVKCAECPIRHRAVCARCDADEMVLLEQMKSYRSYAAGDVILWRGEPLEFVASIVHGVASLSKTMEDGRTQMVGLLLPSDFIGRPGRTQIDFDVTATSDVTLCCFNRAPFEQLVENTPHVAQRLMELALDELDAARDWMLLLGRKTARENIATFIEMLARRGGADPADRASPLDLPMTRDQIANYLGLTLETVSRQFNALKKEGIPITAFQVDDLAAERPQVSADVGSPARRALGPLHVQHRHRRVGTQPIRVPIHELIEHRVTNDHRLERLPLRKMFEHAIHAASLRGRRRLHQRPHTAREPVLALAKTHRKTGPNDRKLTLGQTRAAELYPVLLRHDQRIRAAKTQPPPMGSHHLPDAPRA